MRIVQLINGVAWSGGQQQALYLADGLRKRGNEVMLVCQDGSVLQRKAEGRGLNLVTSSMRGRIDFNLVKILRRLLLKWGADVIDVHRSKAHGTAMVARAVTPGTVLVASRRVSFRIPTRISARVKFDLLVDGIIAVSGEVKNSLLEQGVPSRKIRVIYGGVDTDRFHPGIDPSGVREEFSIHPGERVILIAAGYLPWKGQEWFIQLLRGITEQAGRIRLILAGHGTEKVEVKKIAARYGLDGVVTGTGYRDDVERIIAAADLLVCSSLQGEGMTGAVREAMAMKVPVVSTAVGGNCELVVDGRTGYLVSPGNGPAMQSACVKALKEKDAGREMASRAYLLVRERFSIARMVRDTEEYYREVISRRRNKKQGK